MQKKIALDVGDKTIGVAVSDPLLITAQRVCRNAGTCLLNMLAEYLSQCRVKQVSCRMVTCRMIAVFQIYLATQQLL